MSKKQSINLTLQRTFPYIVLIAGLIGLVASFVLTGEKIHVLKDPSYSPPCNINPIFSCGSVMRSEQADVFGIPNTLFGIVGFSVVSAIGAVLLFGAKLSRKFWQLFNLGMLSGVIGVAYLYYQSVYTLKTLCVYCMTVWVATIFLAWSVFWWSIENGHIKLPARLIKPGSFLRKYQLEGLVTIYLILTALILHRFWYFFGSL